VSDSGTLKPTGHRRWASVLIVLWLAACSGTAVVPALPTAEPAPIELRYATWDNNQLAALRGCADRFEAEYPTIRISIEQYGWNAYADYLDLSMLLDDAPDVFAVHRQHLPALAAAGALSNLAALTAEEAPRDLVAAQLQDVWQRDGTVYGLARDWEVTVLYYNADMLAAADISADELAAAEWNVADGGSFLRLLQRLTRDAAGRDRQDPQFDPALTVQFGWLPPADSDAIGQIQWSSFAAGNGGPPAGDGFYDTVDERVGEALQWYADLALQAQVAPGYDAILQRRSADLFLERAGAITIDGSWMIDYFAERADFTLGIAPLPRGPQGRMSMLSGSADAIWSGTEQPQAAWLWLRQLASAECAELLGAAAAVLPAQRAGTAAAAAALAERGLAIGALTAPLNERGGTQHYPISSRAAEIDAVVRPLLAEVMRGTLSAAAALEQAQAALAGGE
jgi:multiple sugar transport system substrate-binding protein